MKKVSVLVLSIVSLFLACKNSQFAVAHPDKVQKKAGQILAKTIKAHGGKKYDIAHYGFVFRKNKYTFKNNHAEYEYTVTSEKEGDKIVNTLNNNGLTRTINGETVTLTEQNIKKYTGALNSVIYFATLPHKLTDPAVNTAFRGETTIKGKTYDVLEVTFNEEGGGQDHDDEFYYWINQKTNRIDYLAYNYQVNKGGVRFRSAYNPRVIDGILFQDYVNYKAEVGTPLADLPALFEKEELKKLSLIETEEVMHLGKSILK